MRPNPGVLLLCTPSPQRRKFVGTFAVATAVLLTGCAGTDTPSPGAQSSAVSTPTQEVTATQSSSESATSAPASGSNIEVSFAEGQLSGDTGRVSVRAGDQVSITVTSDVADEVHLHGYDLSVPVNPGSPGTLTFQAAIPGVFEVELEHLGTLLFSLQVG